MTARTTLYLTPTLARLKRRVEGGDLLGGLSRHLEWTVAAYEHVCLASLPEFTLAQRQALRTALRGVWAWAPEDITPQRLAREVASAGLQELAEDIGGMTVAEAVAIADAVTRGWQHEGDLPGSSR